MLYFKPFTIPKESANLLFRGKNPLSWQPFFEMHEELDYLLLSFGGFTVW
jgi:hypothetical protein